MPRVIVFDVNETLLDLKALDAHFDRVFRAPGVRQEWFKQVLGLSEQISLRRAGAVLSLRRCAIPSAISTAHPR